MVCAETRSTQASNTSLSRTSAVPTSIHWHGVRSPADMDGIPGLSFPGNFARVRSLIFWHQGRKGGEAEISTAGRLTSAGRVNSKAVLDGP